MKVSYFAVVGLLLLLPGVADAVAASSALGRQAVMLSGLIAMTPGEAYHNKIRREIANKLSKGGNSQEERPSRQLKGGTEPPTLAPTLAPRPSFVYLNPVFNSGNYSHPLAENITAFKWLLVENNVGSYEGTLDNPPDECNHTLNPNYPTGCDWPSIHTIKAHAPIYSSGDDTEWNSSTSLEIPDTGKFMVTIMAEGYRLCGAYFTLPPGGGEMITVAVACQPHPLPLGTIRMFVFEDANPCNGQYDPGEKPLFDFGIGVNDIEGPITEDYYGNSILDYVSDEFGMIEVPNMWPNRYDLDVGPPPNEGWIKTNTLEGGHGWDYWLYEGWDGYDNEFLKGTEVFPMAVAGFIQVKDTIDTTSPDRLVTLKGKITAVSPWPNGLNFAEVNGITPGLNILPRESGNGTIFNQDGMIALSDLTDGDQAKYVDTVNPDGTFEVNITIGSWAISYFDITQQYILRSKTFTVPENYDAAVPYDIGELALTGWYTEVEGFFFIDSNGNGVFDKDIEEGLAHGPFPLLRYRDGTQVDRGFQFEVPFADPIRKGYYKFSHGYPFASWMTMHVYDPKWKVTGYTYRTEQQPDVTTVTTADDEYDIAIFGTPSLTTFLDVGFAPHASDKGSITGAVNYDTTRTNLDANQAVVENHEPGIPGIKVNLMKITKGGKDCEPECTTLTTGYECKDEGRTSKGNKACTRFYVGSEAETKPHPITFWVDEINGGLVLESMLKEYTTAEFERPVNCLITDQNNAPLTFPDKQEVQPNPDTTGTNPRSCIDTPLLRNQVGGFVMTDGSFKFTGIDPGYYALQIEIPDDKLGKPMYKLRTENDVNAYESDLWYAEGYPECPSVNDSCPFPIDGTTPITPNLQNIKTPCAGQFFQVNSTEAGNLVFAENGGSHVEGEVRRLCDTKIIYVDGGSSTKALFNLFTDVPIPARWKGLVLDDRIPEADKKAVLYTELRGIPHIPVGVRDYAGTMLTSVETDANGYFELLVPASRNSANMLASGATFSASMYCLTANDPGAPAHLPDVPLLKDYRPIRACFEGMPGRITPVDLAPVSIRAPQLGQSGGDVVEVSCDLPSDYPELYTVTNDMGGGPICDGTGTCTLIIRGKNLIWNATAPTVGLSFPDEQQVAFLGSAPNVTVTNATSKAFNGHAYDEVEIAIDFNGTTDHGGMYQLHLTNDAGNEWFNGISVHLLGTGYNPTVYDTRDAAALEGIGPIQAAIDQWEDVAKASDGNATTLNGAIILVYPGNDTTPTNPTGAHVENIVMTYPGAKIQGIGPGRNGATGLDDPTRGTELNGAGYGAGSLCANPNPNDPLSLFCDAQAQEVWKTSLIAKLTGREISNNALVEGQVVYVLSDEDIYDDPEWNRMELWGGVDGCVITGGSQAQPLNPGFQAGIDVPQFVAFQGGGVTLHTYVKLFRITNNEIRANSGSYGGAIRVGTAFLDAEGILMNNNTELTISRNSILYNGGFNLAGAIGLFRGSDFYVVKKNFICGCSSQEYGGAISHFGPSQNGTITENWLLYNRAVDEGGGIIIASETVPAANLPADPIDAGHVNISENIIQGCLSGDDGGGLRFLNAGLSWYGVHNNIISHNVALHEGGGVSINDAPYIFFTGNQVVSNLVTGTSAESDVNSLFAAGLATAGLSPSLKARVDKDYEYNMSHPIFFFENKFWDNRASNGNIIGDGSLSNPFELEGLGIYSNDVWYFDMGSSDGGKLVPVNSIVQTYDTFCPGGILYGNFTLPPPFQCNDTSVTSNATFASDANWGTELKLQVLGLTLTLGGSNTFVVSAAGLVTPVDFTLTKVSVTATVRALRAVPSVQEGHGSPGLTVEDLEPSEPIEQSMKEGDDEGSPAPNLYAVVSAFLLVCVGLVAVARRANQDNDEDKPTFNKKSSLNGIIVLSMLGICMTGKAAAEDCTVDCNSGGIPLPNQTKFVHELFIPNVTVLDECNSTTPLKMYMNINENYDWGIKDENGTALTTTLYGYSLTEKGEDTLFPGPTLLVEKDCRISIEFVNNLGIGKHLFPLDTTVDCGPNAPNCSANGSERRATTHLHGGHTEAKSDGHPRTWYTYSNDNNVTIVGGEEFDSTGNESGKFQGINTYDNDQHACTLFYHDHALGITRLNVYAGLAGLYVIEDQRKRDVFSNYSIPQINDTRTIPLAFVDKMFTYNATDNSAEQHYPYAQKDGDGGALPPFSILPEMFGDVMTVNGRIYPYHDVVPEGLYVLRLLNACDSRYLHLWFERPNKDRLPFTVVASDQGLLSDTQELESILMGPAERFEIVISFADAAGEAVTVMNDEPTLIGPVVEGIDDRFMQFRVSNATTSPLNATALPSWTAAQVPHDDDFAHLVEITHPDVVNANILEENTINKREVWITEGTQVFAPAKLPTGGRPLPMLGNRPNPFGLAYHDNATEIMLQNKPYVWELINLSADAHVIHLHQVRFLVLDRQAIGLSYDTFQRPTGTYRQYPKTAYRAPVFESGPKDTVISYPGSVTRIAMKFDLVGLYVWHCHILSHEDNMMIRDLIVYNPTDYEDYIESSKTKGTKRRRTSEIVTAAEATKASKGRQPFDLYRRTRHRR